MGSASRYVFLGQLSLFGFLLVCTVLMPHFLFEANEGGISNYGLHAKTIIPYALAFGLSGLLTIRAALVLPKDVASYKLLRAALIVLGILYFFALASTYPYKVNHEFDAIHQLAGILLVCAELAMGGWFTLRLARDAVNALLFAVQFIGFMLAALTYAGVLHVLFIAEILPSLVFGVLLIRTVTHALSPIA